MLLESTGYDHGSNCHGTGRGFEPRRLRQILNDLSPIWHVTSRYKKVQVQTLTVVGWAGQQVLGQKEAPGLRGLFCFWNSTRPTLCHASPTVMRTVFVAAALISARNSTTARLAALPLLSSRWCTCSGVGALSQLQAEFGGAGEEPMRASVEM